MNEKILILGACGQIGSELTEKLRLIYGSDNVIASDIIKNNNKSIDNGPFEIIDATDKNKIINIIQKYKITQVYQMAAMLSATAEKHPMKAWNLNIISLLNLLELAKNNYYKKLFWPSSIAVFGHSSPKINTPQKTITDPSTVYGISKTSGEHWCSYYHCKYGVDVRSIRYPGIISWKTKPGGGTTDYAIDIFFNAIKKNKYECFLSENTRLPMMYMDDAINATLKIMEVEPEKIITRTSYNLSAISFTPKELAQEIKNYIPNFNICYKTDYRQKIADSWPQIIDDSSARKDWGWRHDYDLQDIAKNMLYHIKKTVTCNSVNN